MVIRLSLMTTLSASEFKAKCLAIMDQVQRTGEMISITKRGREVARLVPGPNPKRRQKLLQQLHGSVRIHGNITRPALSQKEITGFVHRECRIIHGPSH